MEYCKGCGSKEVVKNGKGLDGSQRDQLLPSKAGSLNARLQSGLKA